MQEKHIAIRIEQCLALAKASNCPRRKFGALLVARWSFGLLGDSSRVLLDKQAEAKVVEQLKQSIEADSTDRIADLHCWSIGHGIYAAEIVVVSDDPRAPAYYKSRLPEALNVVHATVEVHQCGSKNKH